MGAGIRGPAGLRAHPSSAPSSTGLLWGRCFGIQRPKIGVPGGELQPKSRCSDREHPERSCCSPQSSPLEGNAPSFLLPGSPPTLACTRGAHGPNPSVGLGAGGGTWGRAIDRRGRRQQRGAAVPCRGPVAGCEHAAGPSARRGCGERLGWETAPCQKRFHRDLSPPTNVFFSLPLPVTTRAKGCMRGRVRRGSSGWVALRFLGGATGGSFPSWHREGERAGKSQERL